jgi:hypothetical protein
MRRRTDPVAARDDRIATALGLCAKNDLVSDLAGRILTPEIGGMLSTKGPAGLKPLSVRY